MVLVEVDRPWCIDDRDISDSTLAVLIESPREHIADPRGHQRVPLATSNGLWFEIKQGVHEHRRVFLFDVRLAYAQLAPGIIAHRVTESICWQKINQLDNLLVRKAAWRSPHAIWNIGILYEQNRGTWCRAFP